MVPAVFKTVEGDLSPRQVRFLPLPDLKKTMAMEKHQSILRNIPQVEVILQDGEISALSAELGRSLVLDIIRKTIERCKDDIRDGKRDCVDQLVPEIVKCLNAKKLEKLQRVINCTGIFIHTNLGRAPLGTEIFNSLRKNISGYCNLEIDLANGGRGMRGSYAEELVSSVTGADDALIVNNNAAAVFLILSALAKGKEVIVSRGELVQIGGGFRIPDIMNETGAGLVEVGTTNVTTVDDFANAVNQNTAMIFSAHTSNFKIQGFTETPSVKQLSTLKSESIIFVRDTGSGNLAGGISDIAGDEPSVRGELLHGADIVCFSADKLAGSCQAGIIAGRKDIISILRKHPLMRMIRPDKITYYLLQETFVKYASGVWKDIPLWEKLYHGKNLIQEKISRLFEKLDGNPVIKNIKRIETKSAFGGGSLPLVEMNSFGVSVVINGFTPDRLYTSFLSFSTPVVGIIKDGMFILDFAAVSDDDIDDIASAIKTISGSN